MKKLFFLLFALCGVVAGQAETISETRALEMARGFFQTNRPRLAPGKDGNAALTLAYTGKAYYAFNRGASDGFVIVAADDRARGVLGYADKGSFVAGSLPESLRYWLSRYERQIEWLSQQPAGNTYRMASAKESRTPVAPIVSAEWNQLEPYNDKCPEDDGTRCPTGCVATALAQIMYTNKWPEKGTGSVSYEWEVNGESKGTLSADFSQSAYNWQEMTDTYGSASTEAEKDAVATLMRDAGYACEMQYTSSASSASTFKAMQALHNYFGYDKGTTYHSGDFYTADEWEEMCYSELAAGRAFFLSGANGTSGHAFVCDGYENGYFHINWGWGGLSNGYFLLDALNPDAQGTGGSSAGYNQSLEAIFGIQQPQEGSSYVPVFYCKSDFDVTPKSATQSTKVTVTGNCYNFTPLTYKANPGIKVVDGNGEATYIATTWEVEMEPRYGYSSFQMSLAGFPTEEGRYTVTPALRDKETGTWYDIPVMQSLTSRYVTATVSGSDITFESPVNPEDYVTVSNISRQEEAYAGESYTLSATLSNTGETDYSGKVALGVLKPNTSTIIAMSSWAQVELSAGASCDLDFTLTLPSEVGEYELVLFSDSWKGLSDRMALTVEGSATGELAFELAAPIEVENPACADPDNFKLTATVSCTSGSYEGSLYALVFPEGDSSAYLEYLYVTDFSISMGETKEVTFTGSLSSVAAGKSYAVSVWYSTEDNYVSRISYPGGSSEATFTVASEEEELLTATGLSTNGNIYAGQTLTATATVKRTGKAYSGKIYGVLLSEGSASLDDIVSKSEAIAVNVAQNGSQDISFTLSLPSEAGKYNLALVDADDNFLCSPIEITVANEPVEETELKLSSSLRVANSESVDPGNFSVEADITCTSGSYEGKLVACVYPTDMTETVLAEIEAADFSIKAGETKSVTFKSSLNGVEGGKKYYATVSYYSTAGQLTLLPADNNGNYAEFTVASSSSIGNAVSLSQPHDISIFTPSGVCVMRQTATQADTSALAPGVYVIREGGSARKILKK